MHYRKVPIAATAVAVAALLAGCAGSGSTGSGEVVTDGDFVIATLSDPGSLDPQASFAASNQQLMVFLYDTLIKQIDGGEVVPQLAESWTETANSVEFTLKEGITCADGSTLTADDVAANVAYVADLENGSPLVGLAVPIGAQAEASGNTVTVTTEQPSPFLLQGLAILPIVCANGLEDRTILEEGAAGTGPYTLTESVPSDHYTLERRDDYTWGPDGSTTAEAGVPATITQRVVSSESTIANLLLSGDVNTATVAGPDVTRLEAADLTKIPRTSVFGEFFYNQAAGRAAEDEAVRIALTQALDRDELLAVSTANTGSAPQSLIGESICPAEDFTDALPAYDADAATEGLAPLAGTELKLIYPAAWGAETIESAVSMWAAAGVTVTPTGMSNGDLFEVLYATGDWDIVWFPADGQNPEQVLGNFSGPTAADGGNNFASIANDTYDEASQAALSQPGTEGCDDWNAAESALLEHADVVPFSLKDYPVWASGASFETSFGFVLPTTIRVLG